jgi:hypothetical protein
MVYRAVIIVAVALTASGALATGWLPNILGVGGRAKTGAASGGGGGGTACTNQLVLDYSNACALIGQGWGQ